MENTNCFNFGGQDSMLEDTAGRDMTANPYDGNSTYTKGAICIQNNKLYEANQNIDVAEQFTEAHWTETTLGDIVSKNKSDISVLIEKIIAETVDFGVAQINSGSTAGLVIPAKDGYTIASATPYSNSGSESTQTNVITFVNAVSGAKKAFYKNTSSSAISNRLMVDVIYLKV